MPCGWWRATVVYFRSGHPPTGRYWERTMRSAAISEAQVQLPSRAGARIYLSGAFRAESTGGLEFALASPVFDAAGQALGIVGGALEVDTALDQVHTQDARRSRRIVALLGPRENDRADADFTTHRELDFIVHPRLSHGREVALREPSRTRLEKAFGAEAGEQFALRWAPPLLLADYRDPLMDPAQGSLAAFAPVGRTGYVGRRGNRQRSGRAGRSDPSRASSPGRPGCR